MRTRKEIIKIANQIEIPEAEIYEKVVVALMGKQLNYQGLTLEVLLDIRDLLAKAADPLYQVDSNGVIEITG